ncbi:TetR/AcrR family transcriptional regulator [Luteimicrobium sp. NPDC057192]|uniref:TetR/AcrR family transcriptional regulator n=1 Tax=Luteimicrobium sp. NPDC057192 TaxID=3346042 RepID=UPI0036426860
MPGPAGRAPRADAVRNRAKILAAADEAFAAAGTDVPLDDVAARAGVGAGTVHRHFPTKEALVSAVVAGRLGRLADAADALVAGLGADASPGAPGEAFSGFLVELIEHARHNVALSEALGGTLGVEGDEQARRLSAALADLLAAAQRDGAVRADLTVAELHAVVGGALAMERHLPAGRTGLGLEVVVRGLRPSP